MSTLSKNNILSWNDMSDSDFNDTLQYLDLKKLKEDRFKFMLDNLEESKMLAIFTNGIRDILKRTNFVELVHESKYWNRFESETFLRHLNSNYFYDTVNISEDVNINYYYKLLSKEVRDNLHPIIKIRFCRTIDELIRYEKEFKSNYYGDYNSWNIVKVLLKGSTLEVFKFYMDNYMNGDIIFIKMEYILYNFMRYALLNEDNGIEITKYIFDSIYEKNIPYSFYGLQKYLYTIFTSYDLFKFVIGEFEKFEKIYEFKQIIKSKNRLMCKLYIEKHDFIADYIEKFHKSNVELKSILEEVQFERVGVVV